MNNHLVIEPLPHDTFIATQNDVYDEIGVVRAVAKGVDEVSVGDKVYFDAWLAAKYPKEGSDEYYWLVKWEDIRAKEHAE